MKISTISLKTGHDTANAIFATAHKLILVIFAMLTHRTDFRPKGGIMDRRLKATPGRSVQRCPECMKLSACDAGSSIGFLKKHRSALV
ncbi:MAG: hypothetical protein ACLPX5_15845 [Dissulfurispiraceae bacterium]